MRNQAIALMLALTLLLGWTGTGSSQEEVPQFAGVAVFPNVFFIFDTSDSMNEVPFRNQFGAAYRPSWWYWKYAIRTDSNGNPLYSNEGFQLYTHPERVLDPNPNSRLSVGNHPESKLFQAKLALQQVLDDIDNVNMGFATYLQQRVPRVRAIYYKQNPAVPEIPPNTTTTTRPDQWLVKYRRWTDTVYTGYRQTYAPNRFSWCGTHTDFVGYEFDCNSVTGAGCPYPRRYQVYDISSGFGADGSQYRHNFRATYHGYVYTYQWRDATAEPNCPADVPQTLGGNAIMDTTIGASCQPCLFYAGTTRTIVQTGQPARPAYYQFTWRTTQGSWSQTPGNGNYINPATLQVAPTINYYTYQLLQATLNTVLVGTAGTTANAYPTQHDYSYFRYPSRGTLATSTVTKPDAWSYIYPTNRNQHLWDRNWPDADRRDPYFPADHAADDYLGDPTELDNYSGDDNLFFVHLPDPDMGDDTAMGNRDKIQSFLTLDRATEPYYNCRITVRPWCITGVAYPYFQYTMMPFTNSIPANTSVAATPCGTPLGATLENAKDYYTSYIDQDGQTQIGCRENYVILLTDGLETCGGDAPTAASELLNLLWHQGQLDERETPVKTYVIGFGLDAASATALNDIAVAGGTDEAFFAVNLQDLISTLTNIFQAITAGSYTRSDPVISQQGDSIYAANFDYPGWRGHVKKYLIDENGNVTGEDVNWYDDPAPPPDDELEGDAGARLNDQAAASRTIYTSVTDWDTVSPPLRVEFVDTNVASLDPLLLPGDFNEDASTNQTDSTELISYIRDVGYNGGVYAWETRDDTWKLGDIYHSTPVVVTAPVFDLGYLDYSGFQADHATRAPVVITGANDGMLHAFDDIDSVEEWAYIPKNCLEDLKSLKTGQRYFIDLPVTAADIWSAGGAGTVFPAAAQDKEGWHTVVIGGQRQGGGCYFALDVTEDPDDDGSFPKPLWEIVDPELGQTWSKPTFGRVLVGGVDKYVAFVGGGYSTDNNVGNSLYIIDIEMGDFLKEYDFGTSPVSPVGDIDENIPSAIRAVDLDRNGYIERLYFASTKGKLYKVDLATSDNPDDWQVIELFDPGNYDYLDIPTSVRPAGATLPASLLSMNRPVFYPPSVIKDRYGDQHYFILYGTGNELDPQGVGGEDFFFEIEDLEDGTVDCNWVYCFCSNENPCLVGSPPVSLVGEKCLSRPVAFNYVVYFTTYTPTQVCGAGQGFIYGLSISRGATTGGEGALQYSLDGQSLDPPVEHTEVGEVHGIPSSPVVTNGMLYFNSSNNTGVNQLQIPVLAGQLRSWQEVF